MNYGFLINNDSCIGCHACSTACKSENEVPLGVQRTWVKSVETGVFPNVRRNFQVTRCNHCANPPCVRICPVTAMYQREDGIVEFDPDACIGCKACLQACPYDAIYIDPDTGTAAKCHYCAHRVDLGLEPACVVVCPEHSILAGDLDNPESEIARAVAENKVTVRKPEQGTAPKLFYIGGDDVAMHPTAVSRAPNTFAWADVVPLNGARPVNEKLRSTSVQGLPATGSIMIGDSRMAEQMTQVVYNAQHKVPWHWQVPAYLVTKGIGAGLFMILSLSFGLRFIGFDAPSFLTVGLMALVFMVLTTAFLVMDLERPERFLRILTRPQWKSWLVRGAYLLVAFSAMLALWCVIDLAIWWNWIRGDWMTAARPVILWIGLPLALGSTVYTAYLFAQAEGRDFWQSRLLPIHLIIQAFMAGAAALMVAQVFDTLDADLVRIARLVFGISVGMDLLVTLLCETGMSPASDTAAKAGYEITHGRYARAFWLGSAGLGHVLPLLLLAGPWPIAGVVAGLLALVGLYIYEYIFVMAPQEVPNS